MRDVKLKVLYGDDQVWLDNRSGETIVVTGTAASLTSASRPTGSR